MKRVRKLSGNVKENRESLRMYPNVPHLTLSLHYKPRNCILILESTVVNISSENKVKAMA